MSSPVDNTENTGDEKEVVSRNFIENIIDKDIADGCCKKVVTRFPPEPNGYLHIGHAKSIVLNSGLAQEYNGIFHLRFDDTNPMKEEAEFVESIIEDVKWICGDLDTDQIYYASEYFDTMYECALKLIKKGKAYVCDLSAEEIRQYRGTLKEPGTPSPYRDRSVSENLDLFGRMRAGEFEEGSKVLRAKIDMASPNMNMRDPVLYRVAKGYASDKINEILKQEGITSAVLNLGGNVSVIGKKENHKKWQIGIQDPLEEEKLAGILSVEDCSVITSGVYQRFFEQDDKRYHHIIDSKTGRPAETGLLSVTIISKNGTMADALSTSFMIMGMEKSSDLWKKSDDFSAIFITDKKEIYVTQDIADSFALEQSEYTLHIIEK